MNKITITIALSLFTSIAYADDSGTWHNNMGTQSVDVSSIGGIHGEYKTTFTTPKGSVTVIATPDPSGGAGDIEESDEGTIYEKDKDGKIINKISYRFKNGHVQYKLDDQKTWRNMRQETKDMFFGDDTVGALPRFGSEYENSLKVGAPEYKALEFIISEAKK